MQLLRACFCQKSTAKTTWRVQAWSQTFSRLKNIVRNGTTHDVKQQRDFKEEKNRKRQNYSATKWRSNVPGGCVLEACFVFYIFVWFFVGNLFSFLLLLYMVTVSSLFIVYCWIARQLCSNLRKCSNIFSSWALMYIENIWDSITSFFLQIGSNEPLARPRKVKPKSQVSWFSF